MGANPRRRAARAAWKKSPLTTQADMASAISYVVRNEELSNIAKIGRLRLPKGSDEFTRCHEIVSILREYASRKDVAPLSIAVFGPPGSGKSHFVKGLVAALPSQYADHYVANLSQYSGIRDLAAAFSSNKRKDGRTAVFF